MTKFPGSVTAFLIHSHVDRKDVRKLYLRLVKDGVNAWMDVEKLQPGQDWRNEIRRALLTCDVVLVCLSRGFTKREGYRHEEVRIALERARSLPEDVVSIIPVRLEACDMPETLSHLHRVDLFQPGGYKRLLWALKRRRETLG